MVRDVLCGGDEAAFDYVVRWAAFMVQMRELDAKGLRVIVPLIDKKKVN